jgi:Type IV secretory pathway, TrbL components
MGIFFVTTTYLVSSAQAEGLRAITKSLESAYVFQSVDKDAKDTRVDINGDGKTDVISYQQGNTTTEIYNLKDRTAVLIQEDKGDEKTFVEGTIKDNQFKTESIVRIKNKLVASEGEGSQEVSSICSKIYENNLLMQNRDLSSFSKRHMLRAVESAFDESCGESAGLKKSITEVTDMYYSILGKTDSPSCLDKLVAEAKGAYTAKKISEVELLKYQLALSLARSEAADLVEGKAKMPQFNCEAAKKTTYKVNQDRSIKISYSNGSSSVATQAGLLEKWGVPGNPTDLVNKCSKGELLLSAKKKNSFASIDLSKMKQESFSTIMSASVGDAFKESAIQSSSQQNAKVDASLAQTKVTIPSPTEASPQALAKIQATQGDAAVQQVMAKQSSGIMTMTNAVMSAVNTQAVAASGSSSGSSRTVASTKSDTSLSSTSNKTRSSIGGLKKTNIGKDEQIVEEILVGDNNTRTANSARRAGTQVLNNGAVISRAPANADGAESSDASVAGGGNPELGGAGRASGGGGGGSASAGGGGGKSGKKAGGGGQAANAAGNSRSPASASSGDSPENVSGDEIVSFIKNSDYQSTKSKLQDYKFQNKLKSNSITIIDRSGNSIGAAEGKIIFVDKGNRFEKQ